MLARGALAGLGIMAIVLFVLFEGETVAAVAKEYLK